MVILVLTMHATDTYSPFGNWYDTDRAASGFGTILFFAVYQSFLQAFFMGLLLFVSGYFTMQAWRMAYSPPGCRVALRNRTPCGFAPRY